MRVPSRLLSTVAITSILAAACTSGTSTRTEPDDPGVVHVHGLAVDPEQPDVVYAATHTGLFRIHGTLAERVGDGLHDLMGFTVADDGTFYASGHPDLQAEHLQREGAPPLLGLVRSTDRGERWEPVSLLGEVDFHALAFVAGRIFGGDATSGRLLGSQDGTTWEALAEVPLVSLAGRAEGDDVLLVGSTTDQLVVSGDGGRTWEGLDDTAPGWVAHDAGSFFVAQLDGQLVTSVDGRTWASAGELSSRPSALAVEDGTILVATEDGIVSSTDGGATWGTVHRVRR